MAPPLPGTAAPGIALTAMPWLVRPEYFQVPGGQGYNLGYLTGTVLVLALLGCAFVLAVLLRRQRRWVFGAAAVEPTDPA